MRYDRQIITHPALGSYTKAVLPSGLTVLLYPTSGLSTTHCILGCKIGSLDSGYYSGGKLVKVPAGTAHFLEHKLFESEEGDLFLQFAKTGANANAYTSFDRTCYLFSTTQQVPQSLHILLRQIQNPYLTDQNVEKEKGIIAQEIRMYDDDPDWRSTTEILGCLYQHHPVRVDIAGTVESIQEIDRDTLLAVHGAYYDHHNMVLSIAGPIDPQEMLAVCEVYCAQQRDFSLERVPIDEPRQIDHPRAECALQVSAPLVTLGFKEQPVADRYWRLVDNVLLELLVGETTDFYRQQYDSGVIGPTFGYDVFSGDSYHSLLFSCETRQTDAFVDSLYARIEQARRQGLREDDFHRVKKGLYGRYVRSFGRPEAIATALLGAQLLGGGLFDTYDQVQQLTFADVCRRLEQVLDRRYSAVSVVWPKQ